MMRVVLLFGCLCFVAGLSIGHMNQRAEIERLKHNLAHEEANGEKLAKECYDCWTELDGVPGGLPLNRRKFAYTRHGDYERIFVMPREN